LINSDTFMGLVNNAALLLALSVVYDTVPLHNKPSRRGQEIVTGVLLGLIGMAVMMTHWHFSPGVTFDTRSILLSMTGLFFGLVPTVIATAMTGAVRIAQGGNGAFAGIAVLLTSAILGLAWGRHLRIREKTPTWQEFYGFGICVHAAMLLWMLALPHPLAFEVLGKISLPVMLIFPCVTVLLGQLLTRQRQRNRLEEELRQERDLIAQLSQTSLDAILLTSPDGDIYSANPAACRMFGRTEEEIIRVGRNGLVDAADPRLSPALEERARTGSFLGELTLLRSDGRKFPGEISSVLFKGKDGRERSSMIIRDVSERRLAEAEREQFFNFFNLSGDIMVIADPTGCFKRVNPACGKVLGYDEEELLSRPIVDFIHPDDRQASQDEIAQQVQCGYSLKFVNRYVCKDGSVRYLSWHARYLADEGLAYATARDITDRKTLEDKLAENEERLRLALVAANQGMYDLNVQTGEAFVSPEYALMLGYDPAGFQVSKDLWLERLHPDDQARTAEVYNSYISGERPEYRVEFRHRTRSGDWKWILSLGRIVKRDASGRPLRMLGTHTDITERKLVEDELSRKNAEIEQFIYTVSHDLRSPLVTVKTFLGYLGQDISTGDSNRIDKDMGFIHSAADRMEALLNELLDMSRLGRSTLPNDLVTYREMLVEALDAVAGQISTGRVDLRVNDADLAMCGDRRRLLQIWQNLLDNALKYMGDQPEPRIEIGVDQQEGETVFYVSDNGIGIAPEYQKKVFGIFEKLDRHSAGVGMGLTMVRRIVEMYGGHIQVESEGDGTGSCFRFTLPEALSCAPLHQSAGNTQRLLDGAENGS